MQLVQIILSCTKAHSLLYEQFASEYPHLVAQYTQQNATPNENMRQISTCE